MQMIDRFSVLVQFESGGTGVPPEERINRPEACSTFKLDQRKAHDKLDKAVDLCYRPQPFVSERNRLEVLFDLYESLIAPLRVTKKKKGIRRKK